jgi:hypothetical protein
MRTRGVSLQGEERSQGYVEQRRRSCLLGRGGGDARSRGGEKERSKGREEELRRGIEEEKRR